MQRMSALPTVFRPDLSLLAFRSFPLAITILESFTNPSRAHERTFSQNHLCRELTRHIAWVTLRSRVRSLTRYLRANDCAVRPLPTAQPAQKANQSSAVVL